MKEIKYAYLMRNMNLSEGQVIELNRKITDQVERVKGRARSPFFYKPAEDAWFMLETEVSNYPFFPQGGWESEEKANLALALTRARGKVIGYDELYRLVEFVYAGLNALT